MPGGRAWAISSAMGGEVAYRFAAAGRRSPLLVVTGSDGDPRQHDAGGYRFGGNSDIYKLLPDSVAFEELNLSKRFFKQSGRPDLQRYECILNLVTDPDQHPQVLARLGKLLRGFKGRVVNRPEAVLRTTRDQVAKRLAGIEGLRVPKVMRLRHPKPGAASAAAERHGLAFPLIVRLAGTHSGRIVGLVDGPAALDAAASGPGEFILTEFADFRGGDGLFRKYRVFFIGRQRIFRHMIGADSWNIHAKERFAFMAHQPALVAEEQRLLADPPGALPERVAAALDQVRERMALGYCGIDFGIAADGEAVLFEANATMNFFPVVNEPPFEHIHAVIRPARAAFFELLGLAPLDSLAAAPMIAAAP